MACLSRRLQTIALVGLLSLAVTIAHSVLVDVPAEQTSARAPECSDALDNDRDGQTDYPADIHCESLDDDNEGVHTSDFFINVSDGLDEVQIGDALVYTVSVRSESDQPFTTDVQFFPPSYADVLSVSNGGSSRGAFVLWRDVTISPHATRSLIVTMNVNPNTPEETLLVAEANAEGQNAQDTTVVIGEEPLPLPLLISVDDGKVFAEPDEALHYSIVVDNADGCDRTFELRAALPPELRLIGATDQYHFEGQMIYWDNEFIAAGDVAEFVIDAAIDRDAPQFSVIRMKVSSGPSIGVDTTSVLYNTTPPSVVDLSVDDGQTTAVAGKELTYEIVLRNNHTKLATDVDLTDALPVYTEFVSATEGGQWNGKDVHWKGLTISPEGRRVLHVTARVRSDAPLGTILKNTVSALGREAVDVTEVAESALVNRTVATDSVMLRKMADRTEVQPGSVVGFTVYLKNTLDHQLTNVRIEDRMNSPYVSVISGQTGEMVDGALVWTVPALDPGEEWTVQYDVRVARDVPHGTVIANVVTATGEGMETVSLTERVLTARIGVMSDLPKTGAALDTLLAGIMGLFASAPTFWMTRRKLRLPC